MTSGERRSFPLLKCFFFLVERLIPVEEANFTITAFPFLGLLGKCDFTFPTASFVRQFRLDSEPLACSFQLLLFPCLCFYRNCTTQNIILAFFRKVRDLSLLSLGIFVQMLNYHTLTWMAEKFARACSLEESHWQAANLKFSYTDKGSTKSKE